MKGALLKMIAGLSDNEVMIYATISAENIESKEFLLDRLNENRVLIESLKDLFNTYTITKNPNEDN